MKRLKIKYKCLQCNEDYYPWKHKQKFCSLKCSSKNLSKNPNKGCFKKGHFTKNKIKKGQRISIKTEFKKGNRPLNWCKVGTIKKRKEKKRFVKYIKIKEPNKWVKLSRYIYEKKKGKIPKGYVICHKDGNNNNNGIKNIFACSRADSVNFNRTILEAFNPVFYNRKSEIKKIFDKAN